MATFSVPIAFFLVYVCLYSQGTGASSAESESGYHYHKHPRGQPLINHYLKSGHDHADSGSGPAAQEQAGDDVGSDGYRFVSLGGNLSVVYEDIRADNNTKSGIQVVSFSDPDGVVMPSFRLEMSSNIELLVDLHCDEETEEFSLVTYYDEAAPNTELIYNETTSVMKISIMKPQMNSSDLVVVNHKAEVTVHFGRSQIATIGSSIVFNTPKSKLVRTAGASGDKCQAHKLVKPVHNYTIDPCRDRDVPCQQLCKPKTGACYCRSGYIQSQEISTDCLATHEVSMTVPGLPKVSDQLSLEANQLALLLESHFGDVTDGSIHGVKVQDDRVVAITMDRKNITAEMSAERLRHHLINANEYSDFRQGADLGLEAVHSIQIRALHDLERQKRESTCTNLRDAISHVLRSQEFDLSELSLPTSFDLSNLCIDPKKIIASISDIVFPVPIPDGIANQLLPKKLQLSNAVLTLTLRPSKRSASLKGTADWTVGKSVMKMSLSFDTASGYATVSGKTPAGVGLSISDVLSLAPDYPTLGLKGVRAEEFEFKITFHRIFRATFYFRVLIKSAKSLVSHVIGSTGLPTGPIHNVLSAAKLDSFDIRDLELLVTNELGPFSVRVVGKPVLPSLPNLAMTCQIEALNIGTSNFSTTFAFSISGDIDFLMLIKGFLPTVNFPALPGFPSFKLPEFSLSIRRPRLPGLPPIPSFPDFAVHLPSIRPTLPRLSLPNLKLPGIQFAAIFKPKLPSIPVLTIAGNLGLGPFCFDFTNGGDGTGSAASLTTVVSVLFPNFKLRDLNIPEPFQTLLSVEVQAICLNRTAKTFTASVAWRSTIELVPSKPGLLSLTNTKVSVAIDASQKPVKFEISAQSTSTLGKFPLSVSFKRQKSGAFTFTATPVHATITTGDIARAFGSDGNGLRSALSSLQLGNVRLSGLKLTVAKDPTLRIHITATVSYRSLPSVTLEVMLFSPFQSPIFYVGLRTGGATLPNIVTSIVPSLDISDIPFFGKLRVPSMTALFVSRVPTTPLALPFDNEDITKLSISKIKSKLTFSFPITIPEIGRRDLVSAIHKTAFHFEVPRNTISLQEMIETLLPGVSLRSLSPPKGLPSLKNVFLNRLTLDVPKKRFCLAAGVAGKTFSIVPKVFSLKNLNFDVCIYKVRGKTQKTLMVLGSVDIGRVSVRVAVKSHKGIVTAMAKVPQRLSIADIFRTFQASFMPSGDGLSSTLRGSGFDSFGFQDTVIVVNSSRATTSLSINAKASLSAFSADIELLFTDLGKATRGAVATFTLPEITLAKVISTISGIDVSGVPLVGTIKIPGTTITLSNIPNLRLPTGFQFKNALIRGYKVTKGVALNFLQNLAGKLRNFRMAFRVGSFDLLLAKLPTLDEALKQFVPSITQFPPYSALPAVVPGIFHLRVTRIAYDANKKVFTTEATLKPVTIIPNLLEIRSAKIKAQIYKGTPEAGKPTKNKIVLAVEGTARLITLELKITVLFDQQQQAYRLRLESPTGRLRLQELFKLIASASPNVANPAIQALHLDTAEILHPLFEVNQKKKSLAFRVSGTPTIKGFSLFTMEIIANSNPRQMILTLSIPRFSMGAMIEAVTGLRIRNVPFFGMISGPSSIGVTLSANNIDEIPFPITSYPLNETTSIERGLGFNVAFRLPENCRGDKICGFFKMMLGTQPIFFRVTGITGPQVTVAFRMPGQLKLGQFKIYNIDLGFTLSATAPPLIGLTNIEMDIPVPKARPIKLRGQLLIDASFNVQARLQMIGIYQKAFGIPILAFGNIDAGFRTRIDCPQCVTQLRLGGEIAIGKNCYAGNAGNCIKAQALMNIDAVDVKENFFFFQLNQLSFSALLRAVGLPNIPPLRLLDTVSVRDVEASYSLIDRNIPSGILPGGKTIKAGLVLRGEVNILFLAKVKVDIQVELLFGIPRSVRALLKVTPIRLGPLQFTSTKSSRKGPKFDLKASLIPPKLFFEMDAKLQITVIGFSRSIYARIDDKGIHIVTSGRILGFQASFTVKAAFKSVSRPKSFKSFYMAGRFTTMAGSIINGVRSTLSSASRKLSKSLDAALARLRAADRKVAKALQTFNLKKHFSGRRKRAFETARRKVTEFRHKIHRLCRIQNCRSYKRVPKPCIKQRCRGIPFLCCRRWRCRWCRRRTCVPLPGFCGYARIPWINPICVAKNAGCQTLRTAAFLGEKAAKATLRVAEGAAKAAEAATAWATKKLGDARLLSRTGKLAFDGIKATFRGITAAINGIVSAFQIHRISFSVSIQSLAQSVIRASILMTVFGRRHHFKVSINLKKIYDFAASLAKKFYKKFLR